MGYRKIASSQALATTVARQATSQQTAGRQEEARPTLGKERDRKGAPKVKRARKARKATREKAKAKESTKVKVKEKEKVVKEKVSITLAQRTKAGTLGKKTAGTKETGRKGGLTRKKTSRRSRLREVQEKRRKVM